MKNKNEGSLNTTLIAICVFFVFFLIFDLDIWFILLCLLVLLLFKDNNGKDIVYEMEIREEFNTAIKELEIDINTGIGELKIDSLDHVDYLYELGTAKAGEYRPVVDYSEKEEAGYLKISQRNDIKFIGKNKWKLNLHPLFTHTIDINIGMGRFNFSLENLKIKDLRIKSGLARLNVFLGQDTEAMKLKMAVSNISLNLPEGKAVSIKMDTLICNNNFTDRGLIKTGEYYKSPDFETASDKLEIEINSPLSYLQLHYYKAD